MLEPLYDAYARSLPPRQWIYLPDIHRLASHPRFRNIIHADSDANITQSSFLPAVAELPMLVPAMISETKAAVTSLLGPMGMEVDEPLDLATSVFTSVLKHNSFSYYQGPLGRNIGKSVLISWDVVAVHACWAMLQVDFSNEGSALRHAGSGGGSRPDVHDKRGDGRPGLALRLSRLCTERPLNSKVGYPWKPAVCDQISRVVG
ncbi:hypothetical protein BD779DRAFT_278360 [Infundibulicybe gibba]|nr:hypothetical protein BD779DRAFT_278360 [Infundibulicybe gibba]